MSNMIFIFILLIINAGNLFAQDTIYWSPDRKLVIEDFQGVPPSNTSFGAVSYISNSSLYSDIDNSIIINAYFVRSKSWMVYKDFYLLNHEQKHFDLFEIELRKLRMRLSLHEFNYSTFQNEWDSIILIFSNENDLICTRYDEETLHSVDVERQKEWDIYIDQMLKELDAYSDPRIFLRLRDW